MARGEGKAVSQRIVNGGGKDAGVQGEVFAGSTDLLRGKPDIGPPLRGKRLHKDRGGRVLGRSCLTSKNELVKSE